MQNGPSREQAARFQKIFGELARHQTNMSEIKAKLGEEEYALFVPYAKQLKEILQAQQQKMNAQKNIQSLQQEIRGHEEEIRNLNQAKEKAAERYVQNVIKIGTKTRS